MSASRVDPIKPWRQGNFKHPGSAFHLPGTFIVTGCFIVYHYFCLLLVVVVVVVVVVVLQYDDDDDDDDDDDVECCRAVHPSQSNIQARMPHAPLHRSLCSPEDLSIPGVVCQGLASPKRCIM